VETLEDRLVPTASAGFVALRDALQGYLDKADGILNTVVDATTAKLPIIDTSLADLTDTKAAITSFQSQVHGVLDFLSTGNLQNIAELFVVDHLDSVLGSQGADVETAPSEVHFAQTANDPLIDIKLHLGKVLASPTFNLSLGLDSLPFQFSANLSFQFDVGFHFLDAAGQTDTLEFGISKTSDFFIKPFQLVLSADATINDPNTQVDNQGNPVLLSADVGFVHVDVSQNPGHDAAKLTAGFGMMVTPKQVDLNDPGSIIPDFGTPKLTGDAHVDVLLGAGFSGAQLSAPSVSANFVLDWPFLDSQAAKSDDTFGGKLSVDFKDVKVNLGTYLTNMLKPIVEKGQQYTEPFNDFFQFLGEPVPVVSDIAKVIGDNDGVSVLDLAGIAADSGYLPEDYAVLINISKAVIQVTNVINKMEASGQFDTLMVPIGDFDVMQNQLGAQDLRDLAAAIDSGFGNVSADKWSALQDLAKNLNLQPIEGFLEDNFGDVGVELSNALKNLQATASKPDPSGNYANVKFSFPFTDNPKKAIFGLLIGQDTPFVSFTADAHINGSGKLNVFEYEGFFIQFNSGLTVDAHLNLAYDTYGLRKLVSELIDQAPNIDVDMDLLNGLYIDDTSHMHIGATIGVSGGVDYTLFQAAVSAHLDGTLDADHSWFLDRHGRRRRHRSRPRRSEWRRRSRFRRYRRRPGGQCPGRPSVQRPGRVRHHQRARHHRPDPGPRQWRPITGRQRR
jgi:hypothetical protein